MQFWSVAFCCKSLRSMKFTMPSKIYRCWTVYGHSWRVVLLPIIFWFGSLTCAVLVVYYDCLTALAGEDSSTIAGIIEFLLADDTLIGFYSSNIATNLFVT